MRRWTLGSRLAGSALFAVAPGGRRTDGGLVDRREPVGARPCEHRLGWRRLASRDAVEELYGKDDHLPSIRELGSCAELRALAWSLQEARQSKLKMMDAAATAHPFFWGAFSLIGGG